MSSASKVLVALVGGLAAGAVLGLLFAPDKGSETRRKISDTTDDLLSKIKTKATKVADTMRRQQEKEADTIYS